MPLDLALYAAIGKQVAKGARLARGAGRKIREQREIGRLVHEALSLALCPKNPEAPGVEAAAGAIARHLKDHPLPGTEPRTRIRRMTVRTKRLVPKLLRPRAIPPTDAVDGPAFADHLTRWVADAASNSDVGPLLAEVSCDSLHWKSATDLGLAFREAFHVILTKSPDSPFRTELISRLTANHAQRVWREETLASSSAKLMGLALASGLVVDVAGDLATFGHGKAALLGGATAVLLATTGVVVHSVRTRIGAREAAIRGIVQRWVADLLATLTGTAPRSRTDTLLASVAEALRREPLLVDEDRDEISRALAQVARGSDQTSPSGQDSELAQRPPKDLVEDLSGRIITRVREVGDERLLATLYQLEDSLIRWQRDTGDAGRGDIYLPLIEVIRAADMDDQPESPPPSVNGHSGSPVLAN